MHQGEQESAVAQLDRDGQQQPARPRRTRIIVASVLAGALVLGGGGTAMAWNANQNQQLAAAEAALLDAQRDRREVIAAATAAHADSAGEVADDQIRAYLADLLASAPLVDIEVEQGASRVDQRDALNTLAEQWITWLAQVDAATETVNEAHSAWLLDQAATGYDTAVSALTTARDTGAAVLAGSENKVADNAVRQTLTDAIAAGDALLGAEVEAEVEALTAATGEITSATSALTAATSAASDAQTAWQAEQERIAAEQAAAAAAAQAAAAQSANARSSSSTGKSSTGKSSSSGRTSGGSKSGSTSSGSSGGGSAPATGGGSTWSGGWDTGNSDTVTRCMDTVGNVWSC